jgi:hypothetical protein
MQNPVLTGAIVWQFGRQIKVLNATLTRTKRDLSLSLSRLDGSPRPPKERNAAERLVNILSDCHKATTPSRDTLSRR